MTIPPPLLRPGARLSFARGLTLALSLVALPGCATNEPKLEVRPLRSAAEGEKNLAKLPPPTVAELIGRGDAAFRRGEVNLAIVEYVKALVEEPNNPAILIKIGDAQRELGALDIAERAYAEALARTPADAGALEGMGLVLMNQKRNAEARDKLVAALAVQPTRWRAYNALGILADLAGDYDQAKTHFSAALRLEPQSSLVLNNLGYSHYLSGNHDTAMAFFEAAVEADADNRKAWSNLALIYVRRQQFQHALDAFLRVLNRPESLNNVGYLCMVTEQFPCATEYFRRAIAESPVYYSEAYANLSRVMLRMNGGGVQTP